MAFATINYYSRSLNKASSFNVDLPRRPGRAPPVVGLLPPARALRRPHHLDAADEHRAVRRGLPAGGRHARRRPGLVHQRRSTGYAYEDDLIKDVVGLVDRTFPVKAERSGRAIGGLSMGGYGAVKIGLKHHEMFASVNSHSGVLGHPPPRPGGVQGPRPEFARIFGPSPKDGPEDPFAIVEQVDHGRIPALRIDCGTDDRSCSTRTARSTSTWSRLHIAHEYEEFPGGHDWAYWDLHVREAIAFHARNLGLDEAVDCVYSCCCIINFEFETANFR